MVADHPYFAITDENGYFVIGDVPAGDYEIVFWQEKLSNLPKKKYEIPTNTLSVTVTEDEVSKIDFEFQKPIKKKK